MIQETNRWIAVFNVLFADSASWNHSKRVAKLCKELAIKLRYPSSLAKKFVVAGLFSDIGLLHSLRYHDGTHPSTLGDDSYFLFLRLIADHQCAELIRHIHCFKPGYYPGMDEPLRGWPEATCNQLMMFPEVLQVLQIAHEFEATRSFTDSEPWHHIQFLVENGRWDRDVWYKVKDFLP